MGYGRRMAQRPRFRDLDEASEALAQLSAATRLHAREGWPAARALRHCAQSIEMSMMGFPRLKPAVVRHTVGRFVAWLFLRRGYLGHDITGPIPGAPTIEDSDDDLQAIEELLATIRRFRSFDGTLQPHFVFGRMSKDAYARLHAMHIADHLAVISTAAP
jgi:hypothetical protein